MFVRGQDGTWYEVADKSVAGKEIDSARVTQAIAEAKAETRKKAAEILASLDPDVSAALQGIVADAISAGRLPGEVTDAAEIGWTAECWTAECWTADCLSMEADTRLKQDMVSRMSQPQMRTAVAPQRIPQRIPQHVGAMTGMEGFECWGAECWGADCWGADCIDWMESPGMGYTRPPVYRPMQHRMNMRRY